MKPEGSVERSKIHYLVITHGDTIYTISNTLLEIRVVKTLIIQEPKVLDLASREGRLLNIDIDMTYWRHHLFKNSNKRYSIEENRLPACATKGPPLKYPIIPTS